jgi:predicted TPR repeat methyltransferase
MMTKRVDTVSSQTQLSVTERARLLYQDWPADYDRQLLQQCEYRSPTRLAQLLSQLRVSMRFHGPWLDLGAGTGLAGRALHDAGIDVSLIAVDLSPEMLARIDHDPYIACAACDVLDAARLRSLPAHGALALGLTEHLVELSPLFASCAALLPQGTLLVFSYCPLPDERARESAIFESFTNLHAHTPSHVARALAASAFALLSQHDGPGYTSAGQPVPHRLVVAQRR